MSLRIQNNIEAFNAHRQLAGTTMKLSRSMERLASGYRINRAADDAAGLAISEKLRAQIGGLRQAQRNAQDAISLVGTAEGAMAEVHSMLSRVRDLAVQFNNGTLSADDRAAITNEVAQLCAEIARIGSDTKFNGLPLLTGNTTITFQMGPDDGQTLAVTGTQLFGPSGSVAAGIFTFAGAVVLASIDDGDPGRRDPARHVRVGAEPARAHDQQPRGLRGEPRGLREPYPRCRYGPGDGGVHEAPDPPAGRHGDVRTGQPDTTIRTPAAAVAPSSIRRSRGGG